MATKIRQSSLDTSIVTGLSSLGTGAVATGDEVIIYDQSTGALKKISQTNLLNFPTITSVSPTNVNTGDGTGNHTIIINGTGFTGASATLINASGVAVAFDSVTVNSSVKITGTIAKSSMPNSGEPYDVRVTAATGLQSTLENQINVNAQPVFTTASGSLGTKIIGQAGVFHVNATDPESAGNVTFELQSGSLPPGYTLTNQGVEGGTVKIAGTDNTTSSTTTYTFILRAVDAASNTSSRSFSIQSRALTSQSFTSSGTFSVPSGITAADVLVVAGGGGVNSRHSGGGGAGGLIFMPSVPLTPGGTVAVTVGCGGHGAHTDNGQNTNGQDSVFGASPSPGTPVTLTAKGGGKASGSGNGSNGGSGGGAGHNNSSGGTGTQPTQSGNSGAYGFGNNGGNTSGGTTPTAGGSGGGGAGAVGQPRTATSGTCTVGNGGVGKAYTIADGTTPVFYAGGGGGGSHGPETARANGGQGGGGQGGGSGNQGSAGQANTGGGGGGGSNNEPGGEYAACSPRLKGGKGVVIVRY